MDWASGASVLGDIAGVFGQYDANKRNQASARDAMAVNQWESQVNRDFQLRMSNTAHQREVDDLKAAGLNPILSANQGAATPGGATGSGVSSQFGNIAEGLGASAREIQALKQTLKKGELELGLLGSQKDATDAQAAKTRMETTVLSKDVPKADMMNRIYKLFGPYVEKAEEALKGNPLQKYRDKVNKEAHEAHPYIRRAP